jgi:putative CocE/NonD family hydrolase
MGGWFDPFLPAQLRDFDRVRRETDPNIASSSRLVIGPWAHAWTPELPGGFEPRNFRLESFAPSVPWFDQFLHAPGAMLHPLSAARIFVMGANAWRDETQWPLARAVPTSYFLHRGGVLGTEPPNSNEAPDAYVYDPEDPVPTRGGALLGPRAGPKPQNDIEARPDVLLYTTPPLERDLEVTGPLRLVLHVSTTGRNTDFTGKLVDVHPSGVAYSVSDGIVRRAYDGKSAAIEIDLGATSLVFFRGHRIRLEISSSNFPRFDRNPNTGGDIGRETRPVKALQRIYHDADMPSRLVLPIVPR